MSCDLLVVSAHPDDAELTFGGLIAGATERGLRVVLADATRGERATRGDAATRAREAAEAARRLGVEVRAQLELPDLGLQGGDPGQRRALVECLRRERPQIVLGPHPEEGHPDHQALARLLRDAVEEARIGGSQADGERHVVRQLFCAWPAAGADQSGGAGAGGALGGGAVVDVTSTFARKREAIAAYASQFSGKGPETRLTGDGFLELVEARARLAGAAVGVRYGEGICWRGAASVDALALLAAAPVLGGKEA
jgi:bacillithiol biosynthesis deacetylase BshB1